MQKRDENIDVIRGIAVFTMVAANMAATTLLAPHPLQQEKLQRPDFSYSHAPEWK